MTEKTVLKRNGQHQPFNARNITLRLERLLEGLATKHIDIDLIIRKTVAYT